MKKDLIKSFCEELNITKAQFLGESKIEGSLYLRSLTSIPQGFNPTVGGDLYWKNHNKYIGASIPQLERPIIPVIQLTWQNGLYTKVDGIFCVVTHPHPHIFKGVEVIRVKKVNQNKFSFIAKKDGFTAHGQNIESAVEDLKFKIISDKLKKDPINKDTEISVMYYRTLTGACDFGCRDFMERNNIPFKIEGDKTIEIAPMKAVELLPLLEKANAYGIDRFKKLITW